MRDEREFEDLYAAVFDRLVGQLGLRTGAVPVGRVARIVTGRSETRANQAVCGATQAEGKSECEIRRCLKRTVARQLFRLMERQAPTRVTA